MDMPANPDNQVQLRIRSFEGQILYFNGMYKLPVAKYPSFAALGESVEQRLANFKKTLEDELQEVDDIIGKLSETRLAVAAGNEPTYEIEAALADIADWLVDIQIFCASEMAKYGLPLSESQRIVMMSNFSKLQADGSVKYDENGKVLKGPGYWKPEPLLIQMIKDLREEALEPQK
jgi:predicted HAD superfamily Cof-like phosphohydrolase